jgi:hypothetical protein
MTTNLALNNIAQIWANVQTMSKEERNNFIKKVVGLNTTNCSFIEYAAKPFLLDLIHHSECYYNITGKQTEVKELKGIGYYKEK